ncbi:MAG: hypothetical protein AB7F74_06045 [Parvibaculaceae bacterium]
MIEIRKAKRGANSFDDARLTLIWSVELFNQVKRASDSGWLCGPDETPFNLSGMENFTIARVPKGCGRRAGYYALNLTLAQARERLELHE